MNAYKNFSTRKTPQSEPIPNKKMTKNSAGGYSFAIDDWKRLNRFLILGSEGGTYYVDEKKLTIDNANCVLRCIKNDGIRTVKEIVDISHSGRAPKNDPALFALAMCAGLGNKVTKKAALDALPKVARIGTHLFHFVAYVEQFRGWGRGLSNAVKKWYLDKTEDKLAYQVVKYQSRDGWSHRDLLRLSHPKATTKEVNNIFNWVVNSEVREPINAIIEGFEKAKSTDKPMPNLISDYGLTREMVPTSWLNDIKVWEALLENMPMTAMIRNLGKMTNVGLLKPMSLASNKVINSLKDEIILKKARIHPLNILVALKTYQQGRGIKGSLTWNPVTQIIDALDSAFYLSFQNVEPTNKRLLLGVDVSGSMGYGRISNLPLSCREASVAMSLITAAKEKNYMIMGFSQNFIPLDISPRQRLDDAIRKVSCLPFDGTDCALPMLWAIKNKIEIDTFIVYTDSETWYGDIHPIQALQQYREKFGIPAKLIVVGMESNEFSIADPNDAGMLDVVGFDTAIPQIMNDFITN